MISQELLNILVCPETKSSLTIVSESDLVKINGLIQSGKIVDRAGKAISETIDGGLMRADNKIIYPIREGIPIMLVEESFLNPLNS
ncbi:hypothetical protein JNK13_03725 [bacterium]|nr:hypothetical protein [bacterium]